jgi:hypothetical protein
MILHVNKGSCGCHHTMASMSNFTPLVKYLWCLTMKKASLQGPLQDCQP